MAADSEQLNDIVQSIQHQLHNPETIAIVNFEGTILASNISAETPSDIGEIIKNFVNLSTKTSPALGQSATIEGWIKGDNGTIAIYPAGKAMLGVTTLSDTNFAMLNIVCRNAAEKIMAVLG